MSDYKNKPAFPTLTWDQLENGKIIHATDETGVSMLAFLACNAPCEIPGWFVHTPPDIQVSPPPRWEELPKEQQEDVKTWLMEEKELPEELKWYGDAYRKHQEEYRAYQLAELSGRYFQWRKYYAEQLLKTLE